MKLEYIILIILAIGFYEVSIKDEIKRRKDREFVKDNLDVGSKIITYAGIIGEVIEIDGETVVILTGNHDHHQALKIIKDEIKNIIG